MQDRADRLKRRLERPLLLAALLTIPAITIDESTTGATWHAVGMALNWTIWLAFTGEVVAMIAVSPDRWGWIRNNPLDIAIVVLTPPFLPATLQAARVFRLLRLLRLLRLAALTRRVLSTEGVRDAAVLAMLTVLGGGAAFAAVEKDPAGHAYSAWDGVWWAITTVTTVGYGDVSPHTDAGRAIAIIVMIVGIGFIALLTAAAAERFMRSQRAEHRELQTIERQLQEIISRLDAIETAK